MGDLDLTEVGTSLPSSASLTALMVAEFPAPPPARIWKAEVGASALCDWKLQVGPKSYWVHTADLVSKQCMLVLNESSATKLCVVYCSLC